MRFPVSHAPFGDYPALSEAETEQIELTVQQTLAEALAEYEVHQLKQQRLMPRSKYKVVKKVENLICYRQRSGAVETRTSSSPASSASASITLDGKGDSFRRAPKLVTVGTMVGTLDDAMFGLLATDATSTFIRASYTNEELLDSELLHSIQSPTPEKPFQFCGVKWHVLDLSKITSKRDFVFVEASGVVNQPNGERVGYHIMHSVDLPGLGELFEECQTLRARIVSCHLFRQLPNNTVDVYMKGLVDPSGHMPATFAITATVSALLKLGQSIECAHSKKLEYLLEQEQLKRAGSLNRTSGTIRASSWSSGHSDRSSASNKARESSKTCAVCATTFHMFRSVAHCALCSLTICSRCRVTRRLSYRVARPKEVKQQNTVFCTSCITTAVNYSSAAVARAELGGLKKSSPNAANKLISSQHRRVLTNSTLSSNSSVLSSSNYSRLETAVEEDEEDLSSRRRSLSIDDSDMRVRRRSLTHPPESRDEVELYKTVELELSSRSIISDYLDEDFYENEASRRKTQPPKGLSDLPEWELEDPLARSAPPKPTAPATSDHFQCQRDLMQRMEELRQNAESVYQLTRQNTETMKSQSLCLTTADLDNLD